MSTNKIIDFSLAEKHLAKQEIKSSKKMVTDEEANDSSSEDGSGTFTSATLNLVNTMIGAGLIQFPGGFYKVGLVPGFILGALFVAMSSLSLHFLIRVAKRLGGRETSFYKACMVYMPRFKVFVDVAIFIQCFGSGISYVILSGGLLASICIRHEAPEIFHSRLIFSAATLILIMYPLALKKSLASLKYFSMFAVMLIMFITCLVITSGSFSLSETKSWKESEQISLNRIDIRNNWKGVVQYLTCMLFAFCCHQNVFKVYNELKEPYRNVRSASLIATLATIFSGTIYFLVGSFGYLATGNKMAEKPHEIFDLLLKPLQNHGCKEGLSFAAEISLVFIVIACFPMQIHPARDSLKRVIFLIQKSLEERKIRRKSGIMNCENSTTIDTSNTDETRDNDETSSASTLESKASGVDQKDGFFTRHINFILTTIMCGIAFCVCLVTENISLVLEIVGATGCNIICLLFPSLFYLHLTKDKTLGFWKNPFLVKRLMAIMIACLGTIIMILSLIIMALPSSK